MAFTAGGRFLAGTAWASSLAQIARCGGLKTRASRKLVANTQCCSLRRTGRSSVGSWRLMWPVLADQESPPYVTAIRVIFRNTNVYEIYLLNVRIFIQ